jgi:hypothetical protein
VTDSRVSEAGVGGFSLTPDLTGDNERVTGEPGFAPPEAVEDAGATSAGTQGATSSGSPTEPAPTLPGPLHADQALRAAEPTSVPGMAAGEARARGRGLLIGAVVAGVVLVAGLAGWLFLAGPLRPTVAVPELASVKVAEASDQLKALDLVLAVGSDRVDPDSAEASLWLVTRVAPSSGVHAGDTVTVTVRSVLDAAAEKCKVGKADDEGRTLMLDMAGEDAGSGDLAISDIACVLSELDTPDSVVAEMDGTRALDGRQSDDWDGLEASWSYHPDDGLDIILTIG